MDYSYLDDILLEGRNIFLTGYINDLSKLSEPKYVFDIPPFLINFFSSR